jgi:transcriptional regulator with XRE-family HTH domain
MKPRLQYLRTKAEAARQTHAYRAEGASIRFTEDLVALMNSRGLTRTALAEKIGTSPAYVTKILRGETNFTLDSMVRIAQALDCKVTVGLSPLTHSTAPKPRTNVNYRDSAPIPSPILNDQPQD